MFASVGVAVAMALIEGVGDEVTLLFGSLLVLLVLLLAWISTRTAEPPEHLFASAAGPAPSLRPAPSPQDTPPSVPSSSVNDSSEHSVTEAPPPAASTQEDQEKGGGEGGDRGERGEEGGDGLRSRGGDLASSQRNMVVRLKFLNDTERTAQVQPQDTIGYIKR